MQIVQTIFVTNQTTTVSQNSNPPCNQQSESVVSGYNPKHTISLSPFVTVKSVLLFPHYILLTKLKSNCQVIRVTLAEHRTNNQTQ